MKRIQYIYLLVSLLIFSACTGSYIREANFLAEKHNYLNALAVLEKKMTTKEKINEEILIRYQELYKESESYYANVAIQQYYGNQKEILKAKEERYLIEKQYFSLPTPVKQQLNISSFDLSKMNVHRENLSASYFNFAEQIGTESFQQRFYQYLAYKKALHYSSHVNPKLQQKLNLASNNLEQNVIIQFQGNYDFSFKNMFQGELERNLSPIEYIKVFPSENVALFSLPERKNLLLRIQIQNYNFVEFPESFSTNTEYITKNVPVTTMENGKLISKTEGKKFPYQKINYVQKRALRYTLSYVLYDKNRIPLFSDSIPVNFENNKTWTQSIPLDAQSFMTFPKTEFKAKGMSKEEMQQKSISPIVKKIQKEVQNLFAGF